MQPKDKATFFFLLDFTFFLFPKHSPDQGKKSSHV